MRILAVDFGEARTGLAICDKSEMLASPMCVIHDKNADSVVQKIVRTAGENGAEMIVVGLPRNMNGSEGERAKRCREVAASIESACDLPVALYDERGSTVSAIRFMNETDTRGKKRKQQLDAAAAAIILESYLEYRKNHK